MMAPPTTQCPRCTAQLRGDQPPGALCDPCSKAGHGTQLPPEFFDPEPGRAALTGYQFGVFFRRVRGFTKWSQHKLADVLDVSFEKIRAIEQGRPLVDVRVIVRIHERLGVPARLLGFSDDPASATVGHSATTARKGSWMKRRNFVGSVATLALSGGVPAADLALDQLLVLDEPDEQRRVGQADVVALQNANTHYADLIGQHGGGYARDIATAHLRAVLPQLHGSMDSAVRAPLHAATAHLALLTAWMHYDMEQHESARRLLLVGLRVAKGAEDPVTTDLTGHLVFSLAGQANELRRPDEAVSLVRLGQAASVGAHCVSPATSEGLHVNLAYAHAQRGETVQCERALADAETALAKHDPATAAPWAIVDAHSIATARGGALYELARARNEPARAAQALPALLQVADHPSPKVRALFLPDLAGVHVLTGDLDTALRIGHQAVDLSQQLRCDRVRTQLTVLDGVLKPMHASAGIAELRQRLTTGAA